MNDADDLSRLLAAERAEAPSVVEVDRGLQGLQRALETGVPELAIAHGPLKLGLSVATKSFVGSGLLAFTVTTSGLAIHAAVTAPAAIIASAPRPAPPRPVLSIAPQPVLPAAPLAPAPAPAPLPLPSSVREAPTLQHELRLIKAAKQELDAGRTHLAKVWLDEHATRFPNGALRREREELRERLTGAAAK